MTGYWQIPGLCDPGQAWETPGYRFCITGTQERHCVVDSGVLGIPRAELGGLECMAEGAGLRTPQKARDLEWGLGTAPFRIRPLDEGGRPAGVWAGT